MKHIYYIIFLLAATSLLCAQNHATYYYKLVKQNENGSVSTNVSGGQFITFYPGICYDTDRNANPVGNGTMKKTSDEGSNRTYQGQSYWGYNTTYYFKDNLLFLRVVDSNGNEYYYNKVNAPSDVTTSSLLAKNKPKPQSSNLGVTYYPSTTYDAPKQSQSQPTHKRLCRVCEGKGWYVHEVWLGSAGAKTKHWCHECGKEVSAGHQHKYCDSCGGTGWVEN